MTSRPITVVLDPRLDALFRDEAERRAAENPDQVVTLDDCVRETVAQWVERRRTRRLVREVIG